MCQERGIRSRIILQSKIFSTPARLFLARRLKTCLRLSNPHASKAVCLLSLREPWCKWKRFGYQSRGIIIRFALIIPSAVDPASAVLALGIAKTCLRLSNPSREWHWVTHFSPHKKITTLTVVFYTGGERGIRTLERLSPLTVFKTAAFNHSAISPLIFSCVKHYIIFFYLYNLVWAKYWVGEINVSCWYAC